MSLTEWWTWPIVQWWYYRRFKHADRKAFARECAEIHWRYVWTGNPYPPGSAARAAEARR